MKRNNKSNYIIYKTSGITLIALVVTIIVLLILAGVTVVTLTGDNGLLTKVEKAKEAVNEGEISEQIKLCHLEYEMENNKNESLEDFMKRNLEKRYGTGNVNTSKMGINCKIDISQSKKIYILKYDGNIKEVPRIEKSAVTKVYGKLDESNKILYLRATNPEGYEELKTKWGAYDVESSYDVSKISKVIIEETIAPSTLGFRNCSELTEIQNIENLHTENRASLNGMFYGCTKLEQLDLSNFDTSNVTNMGLMFWNCKKLKNIDLSNFDTSKMTTMESMFQATYFNELDLSSFNTENVTKMSNMFNSSANLKNINLSSFNTDKVEAMNGMFMTCTNLISMDLSNFNTSNVNSMQHMFNGCSSLTQLDLSNFNTSNVENLQSMFQDCSKLETVDLSNFDTNKVTNFYYMFGYCGKLKNVDISRFKINNGTNYNGICSGVNCTQGLKIKATQDTADKIMSTGATSGVYHFTIDNFEIVE